MLHESGDRVLALEAAVTAQEQQTLQLWRFLDDAGVNLPAHIRRLRPQSLRDAQNQQRQKNQKQLRSYAEPVHVEPLPVSSSVYFEDNSVAVDKGTNRKQESSRRYDEKEEDVGSEGKDNYDLVDAFTALSAPQDKVAPRASAVSLRSRDPNVEDVSAHAYALDNTESESGDCKDMSCEGNSNNNNFYNNYNNNDGSVVDVDVDDDEKRYGYTHQLSKEMPVFQQSNLLQQVHKSQTDTQTKEQAASMVLAQGRVERLLSDGRHVVSYRNGTLKEVFPDGRVLVKFSNGDTKLTDAAVGKVVYYYRSADTTHTTYPDGLQVYAFPNGQIETHYPDGKKDILFPDTSRKMVHPDGHQEYFSEMMQ